MPEQLHTVTLKRAYTEPAAEDGTRILVDRLWPRGLSKEHAQIDQWLKEIAPSNELRRWFNHDPAKFSDFRQRYEDELTQQPAQEALEHLRELARQDTVTLVFAAHDEQHNNAVVLRDVLLHQ